MALDGLYIASIVHELNATLIGGRIEKITQPEKDELILTIRSQRINYKLLFTAQASMPRIHLTSLNKNNPLTPPNFCMLMRKYMNSGRIMKIEQPNFERIVIVHIEHLDELGDVRTKRLVIEIMGRHSNIMLIDESDMILESTRHIGSQLSSVREVFPGRTYVFPPNQGKHNPLDAIAFTDFKAYVLKQPTLAKGIYQSFSGFSPQMAETLCLNSLLLGDAQPLELEEAQLEFLYQNFVQCMKDVSEGVFQPTLYQQADGTVKAFAPYHLPIYPHLEAVSFDSPSVLLDTYYETQSSQSRIQQKSVDIRRLVQTNLERCYKKLDLQLAQLKDTADRETFKIKGELIHSNLYQIELGMKEVVLYNYYTQEDQVISLDPQLTPTKNAQRYYDKYNKKKRTEENIVLQIEHTRTELHYLETVQYSLLSATDEADLIAIRDELISSGYLRFKKSKGAKALAKTKPLHYLSSDGFHIYVGKNNLQNDELTFKIANNSDWWFHTKEVHGSHVIVKTEGKELTDKTYEEAASLAAYYSQARDSVKVTVDYTQRKNLKKPPGSAPGYVIYHTNYALHIAPSLTGLIQM